MSSFTLTKPGESAICRAGGVYVLLDSSSNRFLVLTARGEWFITNMGNFFNELSYEHVPIDVV